MRLACIGPAEVLDAIASMGRTEDVSWSPDGRRVALAAITLDRVLVVGMDCQFENGQKVLYLTDAVEVASTSLQRPHGLCWISNSIIAVASREGNVSLFDIPGGWPDRVAHVGAPVRDRQAGNGAPEYPRKPVRTGSGRRLARAVGVQRLFPLRDPSPAERCCRFFPSGCAASHAARAGGSGWCGDGPQC